MVGEARRNDQYAMGVAMSLAFSNPKKLSELLRDPTKSKHVEAHGMIAIPRKRNGRR